MVDVLKQRVAGGEYTVDARAVADAILRRRRGSDPLQTLCSQMLVAAHLRAVDPGEDKPLTADDGS